MFAITRFRCFEVLFHLFYYYTVLGPGKSSIIPRTSFYRGSLNRGSTVHEVNFKSVNHASKNYFGA